MNAAFRRVGRVCGLLLLPAGLLAQGTGKLVGRVVDAANGSPVAGARVAVAGTALSAITRVDGRFALSEVPAGRVILRVAMIGFAGAAVLYDTSNIIHHYPEDRYVGAALALFSSIILMFWYVLRLLMSRR